MKPKTLSLLMHAVAFSLAIASAVPVFAQSTTSTTPTQPSHHYQNRLNLTADQQAKIKQIRQTERTAIDTILTTDQKAQLKAAHQAHSGQSTNKTQAGMHRDPFAALNLTADQRSRIETAHRTARKQINALLTPQQKQQEQQLWQQRQQ